jgi:hypothetical protein
MPAVEIEPIYIILYAMLIGTAVVMLKERMTASHSQGHRASPTTPSACTAAPMRLEQARAAVEALTKEERRSLRCWMDERWAPHAPEDHQAMTPKGKTPDERITMAPAEFAARGPMS